MNPAPPRPISAGPAAPVIRSDLYRVRLVTALLWTVVIMALCWTPGHIVNEIEENSHWFKIPDFDKLVHGGIFIVFSILWARLGTTRRRFLWIGIAGAVLGILTECVQTLPLIGRDGDISDGIIDIAGVLVGIVAAPLVEPLARFVESRIFRQSAAADMLARATPVSVEEAARHTH